MPPADVPPPCAGKPLHGLIEELTRATHDALRLELPLTARLAADELSRGGREHPELTMLHTTICLTRDAVLAHLDREDALLFPSIRLIEDGRPDAALDLGTLVPELLEEHQEIRDLLGKVRRMLAACVTDRSSPLLHTLSTALAVNARRLLTHFGREEGTLFPQALALQSR